MVLRILIAEDDPVSSKLAQLLFKKQGMIVYAAENGKEVLSTLKKNVVDIILMDIMMPEMDGVEATEHIRNSKASYSDIPIIAITACNQDGDRKRFLDAGMNEHIAKPYEVATLNSTIQRVLLPE